MRNDVLRYDQMIDKALRNVVRQALGAVASTGLPGEHHFYITFCTTHPGVKLPIWLGEKYAEVMTIVVQHEFSDLLVETEQFAISLVFNGRKERIVIPYTALVSFSDPSAKFGLQFQSGGTEADVGGMASPVVSVPEEESSANVIALDTFRIK